MRTGESIRFLAGILWKYDKRYFGIVAVSFLPPCIGNLAQVLIPREMLAALEEPDFQALKVELLAAAMCLLLFLASAASSWAEYRKYCHAGEFGITLNRLLAESVSSWPYEKFEEFASREKYHFAVLCVKEGIIDTVIGCVASVAGSILSLASLLYVSRMVVWWLWIIIALSVLANVGCEIYRANYDYQSYEEYSAVDLRMLYAREVLTWKDFAKESRLFSMYRYVTDTANHYIDLLSRLQVKRAVRTFAAYLLSCIFDFVQRMGVFGYIGWQAYTGRISIADFSMLTLALITISALCIDIAKSLVRMGEAGKYIGAYGEVIRNGGRWEEGKAIEREVLEGAGMRWLDEEGSFTLSFDHVSFAYPGGDALALKDVSFTFQSDRKYGLVGANGSGKTTFVNLLTGMYTPVSGTVSCNGKRLGEVAEESWRGLFSAVFQDFQVYAYKVGENVDMFREEGKVTVGEALERAGIGWLDEEAYLTSEYAQGRELSGGEAQKLAIARAIYRDARIFVFDEPTSALSPMSEKELYENICREMEGKMVFFISHRLASCRMCDEILVFDKGQVAEHGSHEELMEKDGLYAEMFRAQASLYG